MTAITFAAGCSSGKSLADWFGVEAKPEAVQEGVYFAAEADLPLLEAPKAGSKVLGRLRLHEKVVRSRVSDGFALVRRASGGSEGWVINAKLLWKLPKAAGPASQGAPGAEADPAAGDPAGETPADDAARQADDGAADESGDESGAPRGRVEASPGEPEEAADSMSAQPEPASPGPVPVSAPAKSADKPRAGASVFDPY